MGEAVTPRPAVRALAFYLPQFHPTPENDRFWGPGFTEWTNVARARPTFPGHDQPHIPAHLGFYDLRLAETRAAQADLARAYGLHGFVYYHYWFHGRRLLSRPLDAVLESQQPDFPFCLCWANENWTRRWDGLERDILVAQRYSPDDDAAHMAWLAAAFADRRYIRVEGRPLFLVYRGGALPDPLATTRLWRAEAKRLGLDDPYLCAVESFGDRRDPTAIGFDAGVEFQPDFATLGVAREVGSHRLYDYADFVRRQLARPRPRHRRFPCVTPSWDNTARRREGATVLHGATPALYEEWLSTVVSRFTPFGRGEDLVFINGWNEWAEGNHLEPCLTWQLGYLEATARALRVPPVVATQPEVPGVPSVEPLDVGGAVGAPTPDIASRERVLLDCYAIASDAARAGERSRADAIFRLVCDLAEPTDRTLAGKACYKRAQLADSPADAQELLRRCLALCPEHRAARRELSGTLRGEMD